MRHSGSLRGGHYTAYVCHLNKKNEDFWYEISDSYVEKIAPRNVLNCPQAFMLFYRRVTKV